MSAKWKESLRREEGAILVIFALVLVLLLGISAIVMDLAGLRQDRRADRLASDIAATAGAVSLDPVAGGNAQEACETAWDYVWENLADEGVPAPAATCAAFSTPCNPLVARTTGVTVGPYTLTITQPVPDNHPLMTTQVLNTAADGAACQRIGVEITRDRDYTFAQVLGLDTGSTHVASVARIGVGQGEGELVPLLVLEPISCDALYTSGQGKVTVTYNGDTPGYIIVDSNASKTTNPNRCGNNIYTIESQGTNDQSWIRAIPVPGPPDRIPSVILSHALSGVFPADPAHAYNPSNLTQIIDPSLVSDPTEPADTFFRLYPVPVGSQRRITRAPIDWRYNCKTSYPDYPLDLGNPGLGGIPVEPCVEAPAKRSYIDDLKAFLPPPGTPPVGYNVWEDDPLTPLIDECSPGSGYPPLNLVGDYWVNCTGPQGFSFNSSATFSGGNVIFEGPVTLQSSASLTINAGATSDHFVVVRSGNFDKTAQASISLQRTFVYLENGAIDFGGGSGSLLWTAPEGPGNPAMFHAGNYEDLALWSESSDQHWLGGQTGNVVVGTLFTPNALFTLAGQSGQFQADAQFLVRRLEVTGQGEVRMKPDPDRVTPIPIREIRLIR